MSQNVQRQTNQISAWLMFSGAVIGIVGAIVKKHTESIGEVAALLTFPMALADGYWGSGLLIAGAVVALAGLVIAARRPT